MFDKSVITICVPPKLQLRVGKLSETDKNKIKKEVEVLLGGATDIITCTWIILEACFEEMPLYTKKKTTELIEKKVIAKTIPQKKHLVEQHVQAGVIVSFPSYQG